MILAESEVKEIAKFYYLSNSPGFFISRMNKSNSIISLAQARDKDFYIEKLANELKQMEKEKMINEDSVFLCYALVFCLFKMSEKDFIKKILENTILKKFKWINEIRNFYVRDTLSTSIATVKRNVLDSYNSVNSSNNSQVILQPNNLRINIHE